MGLWGSDNPSNRIWRCFGHPLVHRSKTSSRHHSPMGKIPGEMCWIDKAYVCGVDAAINYLAAINVNDNDAFLETYNFYIVQLIALWGFWVFSGANMWHITPIVFAILFI